MAHTQKNLSGADAIDEAHVERTPTVAELHLLQHLRTLSGADYEAQYFDNKPSPRGDNFRKIGNPSALGISVFAVTNTMIALFLMQVRGIQHIDVLCGMLWFTGGVASWITAVFELLLGNTFAWTVFGSFGGYYFAFASTLTPSFQIGQGYPPEQLSQQLGVFFCCWAGLFFIFLLASLRTNIIFVWIFTTVDTTAWCLAASYFQAAAGNSGAAVKLAKAGGGLLFACSLGGWYLLIVQLAEGLGWGFKFPIGSLVKGPAVKDENLEAVEKNA